MIRKFLILVAVMVSPAFGQEMTYTNPTLNPVVEQTYSLSQQATPTPIQDIRDEGGVALNLYDDGVSPALNLGFDFYFFGNPFSSVYVSQNGFISFTSQANGCCSGNPLPSITEWNEQNAQFFQYYNVHNSIFAMWSDLADFQFGNPYYKSTGNSFVVGWYGVDELGSGAYTCNQFGCTQGPGNKFTFEISLFSDSSFTINYGAFDYNNQTGRNFTAGIQGDTVFEYERIWHGSDPIFLENKTYAFATNVVEPPPPPPEDPIAPDCTINPYDPTCIINDITDPVDEPIVLAEETTTVNEEEEDPVVEEIFTADETTETNEEESLEELLAENTDDEELVEDVMEESNAVYRELTDEEKAAILADAISKTTLESALSIASVAETAAVTQSALSEVTVIESSSKTTASLKIDEITSETTLSNIVGSPEMFIDTAKEESSSSESLAGADILESGRQLGQTALTETLAATNESAAESVNQAENISANSSSESSSVVASAESIITLESNEQSENETELVAEEKDVQKDQEQTELVVNENTDQTNEIQSELAVSDSSTVISASQDITESKTEEILVVDVQQESTETNTSENAETLVAKTVQSEQPSVAYQDMESAMEVFASNLPNQIVINEQEELENTIVQQAIASSQTEDDNKMGFAEAEAVTIASDPALANAFNVQPNTASLELLGVLGSAGQDKSDAELRAEQVVAANKEEQDAINANYMEADQSGILAAIGSETDVTSYRTAMLRDNNNWYKPEDIYKGVIIKDNVRGSYFLEKGNTDTYKKMVEEQYK